jgi:para-nitrobenzyl esterase
MSEVETSYGRVRGERRGAHHVYRGIPFAKPPVGELRFRPPQPPQPWTGTRDAVEFGPSAPQLPSPFAGLGADGPQSEDCLYLNVFTPAADDARRPVLFWIHGGAFVMGGGAGPLYDGRHLVERGDVVVVTINYRLGALGYLCLGEHGGDDWGATPNAGQLDQIAALQWVRDNIARFGGDPDNVTVFGESAGSFAIATLLTMPAARGLFHRAICQSGATPKLRAVEQQSELAGKMLAHLGIDARESQKLQEVPVSVVLEAQTACAGGTLASHFPVADGVHVPLPPGEAIARGEVAAVPLLLGSNRDEMNLFMAPMLKELDAPTPEDMIFKAIDESLDHAPRERMERLLSTYRASRERLGLPSTNRALLIALAGDVTFRIPATRYADAYVEQQPQTFMYLFEHESPGMRGALRACHALDIPFVFGTLDAPMQDRFAGVGPQVEQLSRTMMDAWLSFARSGDPSTDGLRWQPYDAGRRSTMILGAESRMRDAPLEDERAAWDGLL